MRCTGWADEPARPALVPSRETLFASPKAQSPPTPSTTDSYPVRSSRTKEKSFCCHEGSSPLSPLNSADFNLVRENGCEYNRLKWSSHRILLPSSRYPLHKKNDLTFFPSINVMFGELDLPLPRPWGRAHFIICFFFAYLTTKQSWTALFLNMTEPFNFWNWESFAAATTGRKS